MRLFAVLMFLFCFPVLVVADTPFVQLTPEEYSRRVREAQGDPTKLLRLCLFVGDGEAKKLRNQVSRKLRESPQNSDVGHRLAKILPIVARNPQEVTEILGTDKAIHRQLLYRRYIEQWTYRTPLRLILVFECPKGQDPFLRKAWVAVK